MLSLGHKLSKKYATNGIIDSEYIDSYAYIFDYIINYTVYLVQKTPHLCGLFSFNRLLYIPKSCSFSNKLVTIRHTVH
jgi:hypothetical protein